MDKNSISIVGVKISTLSKDQVLEEIRKYLLEIRDEKAEIRKKGMKPFVIFTPNPEIISYAEKDANLKQIINSGQINIPDGTGVVWAAKKIYGKTIRRISGADLVTDIAKMSSQNGLVMGLIGGRGGVALKSLECLQKLHPKLRGWGVDGPVVGIVNYDLRIMNGKDSGVNRRVDEMIRKANRPDQEVTQETMKAIAEKITSQKTDILLVGLGFPKQEYFINSLRDILGQNYKLDKPLLLMTVGGTFDYISGRLKRAPAIMREHGVEWLYRLIVQPSRASRQLRGLKFFWKVIWS